MSTRHIWSTYTTKVQPSENFSWSLVEQFYLEFQNSSDLGTDPFEVLFTTLNDGSLTVECSADPSDSNFVQVDAKKYYGIEEYADGEEVITSETHKYVKFADHSGDLAIYKDDIYEIVRCDIGKRIEDDDSITTTITIFWRGRLLGEEIAPDTFIEYLTSIDKDQYPEDGIIPEKSSDVWYKYSGSDTILLDSSNIIFSADSLPTTGGYISASFPQIDKNSIRIPTDLVFSWYMTVNDGTTWTNYSTNTSSRSFTFQIGASCTGFKVGIVISDNMGFISERVESKSIYIVENVPPTAPVFKDLPTRIVIGNEFTIQWTESTDVDGTIFGYVVERSINSGDWDIVYQGGALSFIDVVSVGTNVVKYRVRSYDSGMLYSNYTTSDPITPETNNPPIISGENTNLGRVKSINLSYTVSDKNDKVKVTEYLDETVLKTYTNQEGIGHTIMLNETEIEGLENGIHLIKIVAVDSFGATATRTWVFKKSDSTSSVSDAIHCQVFRKMEDGAYHRIRFENDTDNIIRVGEDLNLEQSLSSYLPELRPTNDIPTGITSGKIIVAKNKVFAMGADGDIIELVPERPPYLAQKTAPGVSDRDRIWIDTTIANNPLVKYWNKDKLRWELIKSIYSGGTMDV